MRVFTIVDVNREKAEALEPLGTKRKYWFTDEHGRRMLFKAEERGTGEDWAEKIACELASMLGLPHVHYELAHEVDWCTPGVVCETFVQPPRSLVLGNELLLDRDPNYPGNVERRYKVREHTVGVVAEVIANCELPPADFCHDLPPQVQTALDVFVGYVLFDAWIANQDRHHENWGAIRDGNYLLLAPTFDHGAALARNLTDDERVERLSTRDTNRQMPAFVRRARSAFYENPTATKPLTTSDAWQAFARMNRRAASAWLERLGAIQHRQVERKLAQVPPQRMSDVCRDFTFRLLDENRNRLVQEGIRG